jgi:hypothetical protein
VRPHDARAGGQNRARVPPILGRLRRGQQKYTNRALLRSS